MTTPSRRGRSGRRAKPPRGLDTEATRELHALLGEPHDIVRSGSARLEIWHLSPTGGVLVGRLSSRDLQRGDKTKSQAVTLRAMADKYGLEVGTIVLAIHQPATVSYEDRLDYAYIEQLIEQGRAPWVAYRDIDRMHRNNHAGEAFYQTLRDADAHLYLANYGRIRWIQDRSDVAGRSFLQMDGITSEREGAMIRARTIPRIKATYFDEDHGWPGAVKLGFVRDDDKTIRVEPEDWKLIWFLFQNYEKTLHDDRLSMERLQAMVEEEFHVSLSVSTIQRILADRRYVDGMWSVTFDGETKPLPPVDIPDPIPEWLYDRVQILREANNGPNKVTPAGMFLLNAVDFWHAPCEHCVNDKGRRNRLRCYLFAAQPNLAFRYRHSYGPPIPGCRGVTFDANAIDQEFARQLIQLARSPELQHAWTQRAKRDRDPGDFGEMSAAQRDDIGRKIKNLRSARKQLQRDWLNKRAAQFDEHSEASDRYMREQLDLVDRETEALQTQLSISEAVRERREDLQSAPGPPVELLQRMEAVLDMAARDSPELRADRIVLVRTLVSKVVVHTAEDGVRLELFGPLVPPALADDLSDPVMQAERALTRPEADASKPSHKAALTGWFRSAHFQALMPAWRSPQLLVGEPQPGFLSVDEAFSQVAEILSMRPEGALHSFVREHRAEHGWLTWSHLIEIATQRGPGMPKWIRDIVGAEEALKRKWVHLNSVDEAVLAVALQLEQRKAQGLCMDMRRSGQFPNDSSLVANARNWSAKVGAPREELIEAGWRLFKQREDARES